MVTENTGSPSGSLSYPAFRSSGHHWRRCLDADGARQLSGAVRTLARSAATTHPSCAPPPRCLSTHHLAGRSHCEYNRVATQAPRTTDRLARYESVNFFVPTHVGTHEHSCSSSSSASSSGTREIPQNAARAEKKIGLRSGLQNVGWVMLCSGKRCFRCSPQRDAIGEVDGSHPSASPEL